MLKGKVKERIILLAVLLATTACVVNSNKAGLITRFMGWNNKVECAISGGLGAKSSRQFQRYQRLITIASDDELIRLTDHANPAVRCYAFQGLARRGNKHVYDILMKHLDDGDLVEYACGCMTSELPVGHVFLDIVQNGGVDTTTFQLNEQQRLKVDSIRSAFVWDVLRP
ncbi:MAG: hypothetical protein KDD54_15280 [Flavobacteriales bacterium]|nr:hypothetical protein [Flavobacteriales bacterium]